MKRFDLDFFYFVYFIFENMREKNLIDKFKFV